MKRFFKPVEKEGSNKKPSLTTAPSEDESNRNGQESTESNLELNCTEPLKFLTWNANSFLLRVKNNWPEFTKFIQTVDPDVICIQEVRMPAAGSKGAPKNPSELKDDTSSSREEKQAMRVLKISILYNKILIWLMPYKVYYAITILLHAIFIVQVLMRALSGPQFRNYNVWWSLSDSKYAGTALFIKKRFQPKKVSFSLDGTGSKHEPDGRVILAEFDSLFILNTYVPNNGWKEEDNSFVRRRKWDKRILEFVLRIKKPLIWCGDLNVSHEEIDVSHPDFFSAAKHNGYIPPNKEDCGQPGFTLAERRRFSNILSHGKLIDAYRYLHKEQNMEKGFSWSGNPVGKYRGKRMRIDYFVVSEQLKNRIVACEIHGQGIELQGFYGSDHCPVSLELSRMEKDDATLAKEENNKLAKGAISQENDQLAKDVIPQELENDQLAKEVNDPVAQ